MGGLNSKPSNTDLDIDIVMKFALHKSDNFSPSLAASRVPFIRQKKIRIATSTFAIVLAIVLVDLFHFLFYLLQLGVAKGGFGNLLSNAILPDGIGYFNLIRDYGSSASELYYFFTLAGVYYIYAPFSSDYIQIFLVNLLFINLLYFLCARSISDVLLLFICCPYNWIALPLPNKDIPLTVTILFWYFSLISRRYLFALGLAALSTYLRDGEGLVLVALSLLFIVRNQTSISDRKILVASVLVLAVISIVMSHLFSGFFFYDRNITIAQERESAVAPDSPVGYFLRLYATATNLAFRPALIAQNGSVSLIDVAYWVSGFSVLILVFISIWLVIKRRRNDTAFIVLGALSLLALDPMIQPRYMFVFLCLLPKIWAEIRFTGARIIFVGSAILMSFTMATVYGMANFSKPASEITQFRFPNR